MRNGDFSVEVIPHGGGRVRETHAGHVLARPGQVYRLRIRNHGPLRAVVHIELDGHSITAGGLVLRATSVLDLERPTTEGEHGRFVVVAEGDERAFGPDGGRDNDALGLIDARFRRELPREDREKELPPTLYGLPGSPSRWHRLEEPIESFMPRMLLRSSDFVERSADAIVERAAGTGLTGHSDQRFVPITLGPLEKEETVIRLRLVVGSVASIEDDTQRAPAEQAVPARPLARP